MLCFTQGQGRRLWLRIVRHLFPRPSLLCANQSLVAAHAPPSEQATANSRSEQVIQTYSNTPPRDRPQSQKKVAENPTKWELDTRGCTIMRINPIPPTQA